MECGRYVHANVRMKFSSRCAEAHDFDPSCYRIRVKGLTETECLAHAKVDCQEGWAISKIARDDLLPSGRTKIESSKASDDNARPGQVSGKSWALREKRVAVRITPSRDIEW